MEGRVEDMSGMEGREEEIRLPEFAELRAFTCLFFGVPAEYTALVSNIVDLSKMVAV